MTDTRAKIILSAEDQTRAAFASVSKRFAALERNAFGLNSTLARLSAGLGVAALTAYGKSVIDAADKLQDLSDRTDVAVKDLAGLVQPSKLADTSLEAVAKTIGKLNLSFSQARGGSKEQAEALRDLNITSSDARERFFQLADAYANASDKNAVLSDIQKVLGRQYEEVLPLIKQGGDALREQVAATQTYTEAMVNLAPHAGLFNDNLDKLKISSAGLTANLLNDLVPAINDITRAMLDAYEQGGLLESLWVGLGGLGTLAFTDELDSLNTKIRDAESEVKSLRAALNDPGIGFMKYGMLSDTELVKRIGDTNAKIGDMMRERKAMLDAAAEEKPKAGNTPVPVPTTTKTDPLASLLGSTDIGKMAEFEKTVALLNARFDYGRKSTELYEQAMTKLVETTFANNFKEAANDAEFMRMVEEDGIKTRQEWKKNLDELANVDMSRLTTLLENTDFARLKNDQEDMILLAKAFSEGIKDADGNLRKLSEAEYLDVVKNRLGLVGDAAKDATDGMTELLKGIKDSVDDWGREAADAFVDFAITGKSSMKDMVDSILGDLARLAAQKLIFGPLMKAAGGFLDGLITPNALGGVYAGPGISAYSSNVVNRPTVFPFARGIGLMGEAGPEAIMPLKRLGNGKLGVAAEGGGGGNLSVEIHNYTGQPVQQREVMDSRGNRKMEVVIGEMVAGEMVRPGSAPNRAKYAPRMVRR